MRDQFETVYPAKNLRLSEDGTEYHDEQVRRDYEMFCAGAQSEALKWADWFESAPLPNDLAFQHRNMFLRRARAIAEEKF